MRETRLCGESQWVSELMLKRGASAADIRMVLMKTRQGRNAIMIMDICCMRWRSRNSTVTWWRGASGQGKKFVCQRKLLEGSQIESEICRKCVMGG